MLHNYKLIDYYVKYEGLIIPKCKYCYNECKVRIGLTFAVTCGSDICKSKSQLSKKHSDETKKVISEKRKIWLDNNPEKHPWKNNNKFISIPCEKLKEDFIKNGLVFETELQPLDDRFYSIDIAFVDKGIGIEVNGNQHYNENKELKPYYKERKDIIEKKGWKLYDIHYTKVYDDEFVNNLIKIINGEKININLDFKYKEEVINKCSCGNKIIKYSKSGICIKCSRKKQRKVERPDKEVLLKDIKELGYSGTGRKYSVSDNSIRKWLKNYD
jgi:very-short-patch-repair endonuclease